jgi:hypothetical protein
LNYARTGSGGAIPYLAPEMENQRFSTKVGQSKNGIDLICFCYIRQAKKKNLKFISPDAITTAGSHAF